MVLPTNSQHKKLNTGWISPMPIPEAKSGLLFYMEDLLKSRKDTVHAQCMILLAAQHPMEPYIKELMKYTEWLGCTFAGDP